MEGWGKLVAGALIGVVGTVYVTNKEFRDRLPRAARDLPVMLRQRFETAVIVAREASSNRRAEILLELEEHAAHGGRPDPSVDPAVESVEDATQPIPNTPGNP